MTVKSAEITEIEVARGFWSRFRGWMGRKMLPGTALLLYPCSSVHTFFMRAAIDVVFLNSEGRVVKLVEGLKPWRVSPVVFQAIAVLEMPAGDARRSGIREGERLPSPLAELTGIYFT